MMVQIRPGEYVDSCSSVPLTSLTKVNICEWLSGAFDLGLTDNDDGRAEMAVQLLDFLKTQGFKPE